MQFYVTEEHSGEKLGNYLRGQGFSSRLIKRIKYVHNGYMVNGEYCYTNRVLQTGDKVDVTLPETETAVQPENIPLDIVFEDEQIMILNKPAGIVVHPTRNYQSGTLANGYVHLMQTRGEANPIFRPVMRLDKNTSGLLLAAKNGYAATAFTKGIQKTYLAIVHGELAEDTGEITLPIGYEENSFIKQSVHSPNGKPAQTNYQVLKRKKGYSFVKVFPKTGRTHQIRVHFSAIGHPLLGDDFYGGKTDVFNRHALHCEALQFLHCVDDEQLCLTAKLPADMQEIVHFLFEEA